MKIIKRNGKEENFSKKKVFESIVKANECVSDEEKLTKKQIQRITDAVTEVCETFEEPIQIDLIEDMIEKKLMEHSAYEVAKQYISYRYEKERVRNNKNLAEKLFAKNVVNQNANVDEFSFGGRIGEAASYVMKEYALNHLVSPMAKANHMNNEIYIHDLSHYAVGDHNCLSLPLDDLLAHGFNTRQTDIRPASSINTAFQLVAVLFQIQSLQQFGGVAATHLDWTMVPYVRKSFYKHFLDGVSFIMNVDAHLTVTKEESAELSINHRWYTDQVGYAKAYKYAMKQTKKELEQAVEGMYHNLNSLQSRSGSQLPFSSINYGTCTLPEGRMVIKALLEGSIKGVGKFHKTSIFPCGIFQCMKGVNRAPGDPNYDMFRLALKSTSTRLYPNYVNVDWSTNAGYDRNDPRTYTSTMGALDGKEHLYVKIGDGQPIDITIKELFNAVHDGRDPIGRPAQIVYTKESLDLPGKTKRVQDHSFETCGKKAGVYRITYIPQDVSYIGSSSNMGQRWNEHKVSIRCSGGPDCGIKFGDPCLDNYKFEVIEYTDDYKSAEEKYILHESNINIRGTDKKYYKNIHRKWDPIYDRPDFYQCADIPQILINLEDKDIKVLDRGNTWVKVRHIFMNNRYNSPFMMHIRYQEYDKEHVISCTEDHPLWTGENFTQAKDIKHGDLLYRADGKELPVIETSWHWEPVDSYDIGTETGTFIGSDIVMHNCRTYNGFDINGLGQMKDGRGNICPVTIILPTLAMEAKESVTDELKRDNEKDIEWEEGAFEETCIEKFMKLLDKKINEAKDMLLERFDWICSQPMKSARFMYENGTMFGYVPEEGIRSALKHGTLVIGQLAMAETLQLLVGCDHTEPKGMELAKRIEQLFKDRCAEFKKKYKLNFGVYYTPAENLCYTAMKKFQDKYGVIPNVSDKEFFTNSIHVPVWKKMTPFEKIDIEAQLTGYSNAGCITYVELDSGAKNNIDALETMVNYAMDKDIPYFAINVPSDTCMSCGYQDEINDKCPECGGEDIQRLRRVTGYLTGDYKTAFNKGKQDEAEHRVKHSDSMENWKK